MRIGVSRKLSCLGLGDGGWREPHSFEGIPGMLPVREGCGDEIFTIMRGCGGEPSTLLDPPGISSYKNFAGGEGCAI